MKGQSGGQLVWAGITVANKPSELAPHPVTMLGDFTDIRFRQQANLRTNHHLGLQFRQRAPGDVQKLKGIPIAALGVSLGYIRRHGNRRSPELIDKPCI